MPDTGFNARKEMQTQSMPPTPGNGTRLRVLTYNIHSCLDQRREVCHDRTLRALKLLNPDVAALQEIDVGIPRTGGVDQIRYIAENLGLRFAFCPAVIHPRGRYGIGILSRYPLEVYRCGRLPALRPFRFERRCALHAGLHTPGGRVQLFNTHLGLFGPERRIQAAALAGKNWMGSVSPGEPIVFCGDLNAGPRSPAYRRLSVGLRDVQQSDDGQPVARPTFSAQRPFLRLDHMFVSRHFRVLAVDVPRGEFFRKVSDHLPLCVDLILGDAGPASGR
jgi:endonuclease/exonuclease/phosphatase family metal-dependent hydrolase